MKPETSKHFKGWVIFGFFLCVAVVAMGYVTQAVWKLEQANQNLFEVSRLEENIRTALWRVDPLMSDMVLTTEIGQSTNPLALTHFAISPEQGWKFTPLPQSDHPELSQGLDTIKATLDPHELVNRVPPETLPSVIDDTTLDKMYSKKQQVQKNSSSLYSRSEPQQELPEQKINSMQQEKSDYEYSKRQSYDRQNMAQTKLVSPTNLSVVPLTPLFVDDQLILARHVIQNQSSVFQGCLVDWPTLQQQLTEQCRDLLPHVRFEPADAHTPDNRKLASLPLKIIPGPLPPLPIEARPKSNLAQVLTIAWLGLALAFVAAGVLMHGAHSLSERRATFVSAVTHELRTPLTTFKMYTDLLKSGKLDNEQTSKYLDTISDEADRLSHMVENVLAFSKLENTGKHKETETFTPDQIIDLTHRLMNRPPYSHVQLDTALDESAKHTTIQANFSGVEHILQNLIDNAIKYACESDNTLKLIIRLSPDSPGFIDISLMDNGPGIRETERLFKPFSKSVHEAASSKPGIGLGLALCRDLAREMGGDLVYAPNTSGGSIFILKLKTN